MVNHAEYVIKYLNNLTKSTKNSNNIEQSVFTTANNKHIFKNYYPIDLKPEATFVTMINLFD